MTTVETRCRLIQSTLVGRLFGNRLSIGSGIGGAEIHAWSVVVHNGIAAPHHLRVARYEVNLVTLGGEFLKDLAWVAVLNIDGAAGVTFVEPGSIHSGLDIHVEINNVGNELRVRLGLVEAGHNTEANGLAIFLHHGGDNRVQRTFVTCERVGLPRLHVETGAAVLQAKPVCSATRPAPKLPAFD